jgi:hypothetical protein
VDQGRGGGGKKASWTENCSTSYPDATHHNPDTHTHIPVRAAHTHTHTHTHTRTHAHTHRRVPKTRMYKQALDMVRREEVRRRGGGRAKGAKKADDAALPSMALPVVRVGGCGGVDVGVVGVGVGVWVGGWVGGCGCVGGGGGVNTRRVADRPTC